jgi:hypothetical protein
VSLFDRDVLELLAFVRAHPERNWMNLRGGSSGLEGNEGAINQPGEGQPDTFLNDLIVRCAAVVDRTRGRVIVLPKAERTRAHRNKGGRTRKGEKGTKDHVRDFYEKYPNRDTWGAEEIKAELKRQGIVVGLTAVKDSPAYKEKQASRYRVRLKPDKKRQRRKPAGAG